MDELRGGAPPEGERTKLWLVQTLLHLRVRYGRAFDAEAGYEPVDAGDGVVAFVRAPADESAVAAGAALVAVAVRPGAAEAAVLPALGGSWRDALAGASGDALDGGEIVLDAPYEAGSLLGELGLAVLVRD